MLPRFVLLGFALLFAAVVQARELQVALGVQDSSLSHLLAEANKPVPQAGGLPGFNEALAREICRRIAARCVFSYMAFAEIMPGVEAGLLDMGFGNYLRTAEREKRVAFSEPVWRSSSRLVARPQVVQNVMRKLKQELTLDTLRGVRIAAIDGSLQHAFLLRVAEEQMLTVVPVRTMSESLTALKENRVDFTLLPMLSAYTQMASEAPGNFEFVGPAIADRGLGGTVHIAIPRQKEGVLWAVNQAIVAMRSDGTYQRIVHQFFSFSLD